MSQLVSTAVSASLYLVPVTAADGATVTGLGASNGSRATELTAAELLSGLWSRTYGTMVYDLVTEYHGTMPPVTPREPLCQLSRHVMLYGTMLYATML